jgi:hypothetical protein
LNPARLWSACADRATSSVVTAGVRASTRTFPSLAELLVVPFDSSLGIAPAFPAFALIVGSHYREPTWLAHTLWTRYPPLTNPLPEIFADVLSPRVEQSGRIVLSC